MNTSGLHFKVTPVENGYIVEEFTSADKLADAQKTAVFTTIYSLGNWIEAEVVNYER